MIQKVSLRDGLHLEDYAGLAYLASAVHDLRMQARLLLPKLKGRRIWMVNSTAQGGGVAEMMPRLVGILKDLGVKAEWLVMGSEDSAFFALTKRLHNMIHDFGRPGFSDEEKKTYAASSRKAATSLARRIGAEDILVIHDPQPLGAGRRLSAEPASAPSGAAHRAGSRRRSPTPPGNSCRKDAQVYDHAVFTAVNTSPLIGWEELR